MDSNCVTLSITEDLLSDNNAEDLLEPSFNNFHMNADINNNYYSNINILTNDNMIKEKEKEKEKEKNMSPNNNSINNIHKSWSSNSLNLNDYNNRLSVFASPFSITSSSPFLSNNVSLQSNVSSFNVPTTNWSNNIGFDNNDNQSIGSHHSLLHNSSSMPSKLNTLSLAPQKSSSIFLNNSISLSHQPTLNNYYSAPTNNPSSIPTSNSILNPIASSFEPGLSVDNRPIRRIVSLPSFGILVRCTNVSLGCIWRGHPDKLSSHIGNECLYQTIPCRYAKSGCSFSAIKHEMPLHEEREMRRHLDLCDMKVDELTNHINVLESRRKKSENTVPQLENLTEFTDDDLIQLLTRILLEHGKASVGKLGSLLHSYTNNHSLSSLCKEKYGGLKKFLELHTNIFTIGQDHPFNPSVWLASSNNSMWSSGFGVSVGFQTPNGLDTVSSPRAIPEF